MYASKSFESIRSSKLICGGINRLELCKGIKLFVDSGGESNMIIYSNRIRIFEDIQSCRRIR